MPRLARMAVLIAAIASPGAAQTVPEGETVFRKCLACHQVGDGARNRTGPVLTNVIGRAAASAPGFAYSASMQAAGAAGLVWDEALLFDYLADPTGFLRTYLGDPGARARMTFRLSDPDQRRAVSAYLAGFQSASVPSGGFCIENAAEGPHLFVTETREGTRQVAELNPGERLCAEGSQAADGLVSVYESADGFEGCTRIVPVGTVERMLEFAEFDRCLWGSHRS